MILKMWVKSKFVLWKPPHYKLLEKSKKIYDFEALTVSKTYCYGQSQEIIFKHHLQMVYFQQILHSQIQFFLVEELIRWKKAFETFLIDHYTGDIDDIDIADTY